MMTTDPSDFLPGIPKDRILVESRRLGESKARKKAPSRRPTMALRLALSAFAHPPREGVVPMRFFTEEDIQIYLGMPNHPLNGLLRLSGQTTSRKIVDAVFPRHRDKRLSAEERLRVAEGLPDDLKPWLARVLRIIARIRQDGWEPPPISVLNFRKPRRDPWICRAEHLCGQVPDGTHRVLAYTVLGAEFPEMPVSVRVLCIHPVLLGVVNSLTITLSYFVDRRGTSVFVKKRFAGSASFDPTTEP